MDFIGEGVDVIIEGNDRKQKKKESLWGRNLRQGKYAKALDSVLEQKDSLTVNLPSFLIVDSKCLDSSFTDTL
jgi:hypothetical protein